MKKTVFILLLIACFSNAHLSADSEIDSLMSLYEKGQVDASLLNSLAMVWYPVNIDSGKYFSSKALQYALATSDDAQLAEAYYQKGDGYYYEDLLDTAITFYQKSLEYYLKTKLNNEIAGVANDIGQVFHLLHKNDSSLYYYQIALSFIDAETLPEGYYSIRINMANTYYFLGKFALANEQLFKVLEEGKKYLPVKKIAVIYNNIGLNYKRSGAYAKAIDYYQKALLIDDSLHSEKDLEIDYVNMGNTFYQWKKFDRALQYFDMALKIAKERNDKRQMAKDLSNIAGALRGKKDFRRSIEYYQKALALATEVNDRYTIGIINYGQGMTYYEEGEYGKALALAQKAEKSFRQLNNEYSITSALVLKARLYMAMNQSHNAMSLLNEADSLAKDMHSLEMQKDIAYLMATNASITGKHKLSNQWYEKYIQLNDSVFSKHSHELLTNYEVKMNMLQKQRQLEETRLKNDIQAQRIVFQKKWMWMLGASATVFLILGLISWWLYVGKSRSYRALFEKNQEQLKIEEEKNHARKEFIKNETAHILMEKLLHKMEEEEYFLNQDISSRKLAEDLGTNTTYLSLVINTHFGTNFNDMVNKYRINKAQKLLLDKNYLHFTIEAVAKQCGFNSKSAFNLAFKKFTGLTPSYYQKQSF